MQSNKRNNNQCVLISVINKQCHCGTTTRNSLYAPSQPKPLCTSLQADGIRSSAQSLVGSGAYSYISALFAKKPEVEENPLKKDATIEEISLFF